MVHLLRERLLISAERFYPQVNLSIQATLRNTVIGDRQLPPWPRTELESKPQERAQKTSWPPAAERVVVGRDTVRVDRATSQVEREAGPREGLISREPLRLVFQRLSMTDGNPGSVSLERVIARSGEMILRRVTGQSQRIETMPTTASALITKQARGTTPSEASSSVAGQPITASMIEQVVSRKLDERSAARSSSAVTTHRAPWASDSASAASINVDQLADHVMRKLDWRIEAWRERTGRV